MNVSFFLFFSQWLYKILGVHEFFSESWIFKYLSDIVCAFTSITEKFCENIIFILIGFDEKNLDIDRIPIYTSHTPAGTSVMNAVHFIQVHNIHYLRFFVDRILTGYI